MNQVSFESGLWNKNADFSLAADDTQGQLEVIVLPVPADARPAGVVHVGGVAGNGPSC